jgi:hypothetical protein
LDKIKIDFGEKPKVETLYVFDKDLENIQDAARLAKEVTTDNL